MNFKFFVIFFLTGCSSYNPLSFKKVKKLCLKGDQKACIKAGNIKLGQRKYLSAFKIYKYGCSKNIYLSCSMMGKVQEKMQKIDDAKVYYKLGCDKGDGFGCYQLAKLVYRPNNQRYFLLLLKKACNLGVKKACGKKP